MMTRMSGSMMVTGTLLGMSLASPVLASPSLPITKPPVQSTALLTGPNVDPAAVQGQWFVDEATRSVQSVRSHEFYDNLYGNGGSQLHSTGAILAWCDNITRDTGTNAVTGFSLSVTIINDTMLPASGSWLDGSNSHGETLSTTASYHGTMYGTRLAIEFATADAVTVPAGWLSPYQAPTQVIQAVNEDALAWYCYNGSGNYYVPTWDFGDIAPGQAVTRTLAFVTPNGLPESVVDTFLASGPDILMNRTSSLKISNWVEGLVRDDGTAYPSLSGALSSNSSVFHNIPEPASLSLLSLTALAMLKRRR